MSLVIGCDKVDKSDNEIKDIQIGKSDEEMLQYLISEYKMNTKTLSKLLEVEPSVVDDFNKNKNAIPMIRRGEIGNTLAGLYYISEITADERNRAVMDVLVQEYNIEFGTIASMAGIEEEELINFMEGNEPISYEVKYKIATISMFLHFMFKPSDNNLKLMVKAINVGLDNESIKKLVGVSYEEIDVVRKLCEQY